MNWTFRFCSWLQILHFIIASGCQHISSQGLPYSILGVSTLKRTPSTKNQWTPAAVRMNHERFGIVIVDDVTWLECGSLIILSTIVLVKFAREIFWSLPFHANHSLSIFVWHKLASFLALADTIQAEFAVFEPIGETSSLMFWSQAHEVPGCTREYPCSGLVPSGAGTAT
jgi:hypothetical protein